MCTLARTYGTSRVERYEYEMWVVAASWAGRPIRVCAALAPLRRALINVEEERQTIWKPRTNPSGSSRGPTQLLVIILLTVSVMTMRGIYRMHICGAAH